jgi:hypothetical protein
MVPPEVRRWLAASFSTVLDRLDRAQSAAALAHAAAAVSTLAHWLDTSLLQLERRHATARSRPPPPPPHRHPAAAQAAGSSKLLRYECDMTTR